MPQCILGVIPVPYSLRYTPQWRMFAIRGGESCSRRTPSALMFEMGGVLPLLLLDAAIHPLLTPAAICHRCHPLPHPSTHYPPPTLLTKSCSHCTILALWASPRYMRTSFSSLICLPLCTCCHLILLVCTPCTSTALSTLWASPILPSCVPCPLLCSHVLPRHFQPIWLASWQNSG